MEFAYCLPEMDRAFAVLRRYARDHNLRLTDGDRAPTRRAPPTFETATSVRLREALAFSEVTDRRNGFDRRIEIRFACRVVFFVVA